MSETSALSLEARNPCHKCQKRFLDTKSYRKHMNTHKLIDVVSRVPDLSQLLNSSKSIGRTVLDHLARKPSFGQMGQQYKTLVCSLIEREDAEEWENFVSFICKQFLEPFHGKPIARQTDVGNESMKVIEVQFKKKSIEEQSKKLLIAAIGSNACESQIINFVLFGFLLYFQEEFQKSLWDMVRAVDDLVIPVVTIDERDRQTIHSISGSVIKGFMKFGWNSPDSNWQKIVSALKKKFIVDFVPPLSLDTVMTCRPCSFVGPQALNFFETLAKILTSFDYASTKCLPHADILNVVLTGVCYHLWDELINGSLTLKLSLNLLEGVTKSFTNVYSSAVSLQKIK